MKKRKKIPLPPRPKEQRQIQFLTRGIAVSSVCFLSSLTVTFFPQLPQKTAAGIRQGAAVVQSGLDRLGDSVSMAAARRAGDGAGDSPSSPSQTDAGAGRSMESPKPSGASPSSRETAAETDDWDIVAEPVPGDGAVYNAVLPTALGPMTYYNQGDARWRDYLFGGADPMHTYGCGPTVAAMLADSFSPGETDVTPSDMADWAFEHGHYAPQGGSYRSLIPESLSSYGLTVASVKDHSAAAAAALLDSGHVLVALMGPGTFTQKGHFIIVTQLKADGTVSIADPASMENSEKTWDLNLIMNELKKVSDNGAPLWAVSR